MDHKKEIGSFAGSFYLECLFDNSCISEGRFIPHRILNGAVFRTLRVDNPVVADVNGNMVFVNDYVSRKQILVLDIAEFQVIRRRACRLDVKLRENQMYETGAVRSCFKRVSGCFVRCFPYVAESCLDDLVPQRFFGSGNVLFAQCRRNDSQIYCRIKRFYGNDL